MHLFGACNESEQLTDSQTMLHYELARILLIQKLIDLDNRVLSVIPRERGALTASFGGPHVV